MTIIMGIMIVIRMIATTIVAYIQRKHIKRMAYNLIQCCMCLRFQNKEVWCVQMKSDNHGRYSKRKKEYVLKR